jgi:hypothetical protein
VRIEGQRGVLAIMAVFTVIGIAIMSTGEAEELIIGGLVVLFFGGGAIMVLVMSRPPPRHELDVVTDRMEVGTVTGSARLVPRGRRDGVLLLASRRSLLAPFAGAIVFVIVGGVFIWAAGGPFTPLGLLGTVTVVVFGTFGVANARGILGPSGLAFLPDGVLSIQPTGRAFVPWDALESFGIRRQLISGLTQEYLAITVINGAPKVRMTGLLRLLRSVQRSSFGMDVSLGQRLPISMEETVALVAWFVEHPDERPVLGTARGGHVVAKRIAQGRR